jgi:hypothetical protein
MVCERERRNANNLVMLQPRESVESPANSSCYHSGNVVPSIIASCKDARRASTSCSVISCAASLSRQGGFEGLSPAGQVLGPPRDGQSAGLWLVGMKMQWRTRPPAKHKEASCRRMRFNGIEDDRPLHTAPMTTLLSSNTTMRWQNR